MSNKFLSDIPEVLSELFESLFPWIAREKQEAEELAFKAEATVRQLSGLPPVSSNGDRRELISMLQSTCLLLERFQERPELLNINQKHKNEELEVINNEKLPETPHTTVESPPSLIVEREPEPSVAAQEIIKLRDWILLAQSESDSFNYKVLEAIYQQLAQILAKEGVKPLEETGLFNYERHKIISTQKTEDPDKDDWVCETVRPGYLFEGKLIRPQEVIVYTFESSATTTQ
jgi:hypothetical protein